MNAGIIWLGDVGGIVILRPFGYNYRGRHIVGSQGRTES